MKKNSNSSAIVNAYTDFVNFFGPDYVDKTYDKTYDKTDDKTDDKPNNEANDEEIDTKDMPNLETEEYAEQRRKQEAKGLKISTPQQIFTRLLN